MDKQQLLQLVLDRFKSKPNVAILMSGTGSNAINILKNKHEYQNLEFTTIITDKEVSNAKNIATEFGLDIITCEGNVSTPELRNKYFLKLSRLIRSKKINLLLYAGFMKVATRAFVYEFPGVNMHPSDLTIVDHNGLPKYRGLDAINMVIDSGESSIASTLYVVDESIDAGSPLAISESVKISSDIKISDLHENLKKNGEHKLYPIMLKLLSKGDISIKNIPLRF